MSTMTFDIQTFQGAGRNGLKGLIARSPPSRLLNLHALKRTPPADPAYVSRPFFLQPMLNRAIIAKHNMRQGEEGRDGQRRLNALKLIFPLDAANLSIGAQYLLASREDFTPIFLRFFESLQPAADRDLKLIGLLDDMPTLDPFVLQELVRYFDFDVAQCYFSNSQRVLLQQSEIVAAEANPILKMVHSSASIALIGKSQVAELRADDAMSPSMINDIIGEREILEQELSERFFNWKIVLFYRWRLNELNSACKRMLVSIARLKANDGPASTTPLAERNRRRVYDAISSALSGALAIVEDYDVLHYTILHGAHLGLFQTLLFQSRMYLQALGARISRLEDALGFWSAHAPGGPDRIDTYTLENFMLSFDRHIGSDLPLPEFTHMAPNIEAAAPNIRGPVSSRAASS
jgi:hypothetical protein